jgi:hypothetical protein
MTSRRITKRDVDNLRKLFRQFAQDVLHFYDYDVVALAARPNIHLMQHVPDCIMKYGALFNWCFRFESLNGITARFPNNNKDYTVRFPEVELLS